MEKDFEFHREGFAHLVLDKIEDHDWKRAGLNDLTMRLAVPGPLVRTLFRLYVENQELKNRLEALEKRTPERAVAAPANVEYRRTPTERKPA